MLTVRRRPVVVNLVDGRTTLVGERRWSWPWQVKLTGARLHRGPGHPEQPVDGVVLIPRHRIDFVQVVS
ncbi:hypothetical protein [Micromonospora sp. WMMD980]|uniref:hypothetical protein n=1 Tax=Micromonospora sp. WMMD980 TaxID=3016088 RepID=UPI002417E168|nr:hypothetical protein [Micromonospora sp. WMMD980]MDG4799040.1 hypothetical protein [Micromonospora sp. WMMD980]